MSKDIKDCMESVFVNVSLNSNLNIKIGCMYKAPNTDIPNFNDELFVMLEKIKHNKMYICGDFNIDLLKYDCHQNSRSFIDLFFSLGFYPLITKPTRITNSTSSLIDNIFTNEFIVQMNSGLLISMVSDGGHLATS